MKIAFDCFYGDKKLNQFMHACDVFETGKQLAQFKPFETTLTLEEGKETLSDEEIEKVYNLLWEQTGKEYNLVFLAIRSVDDVKTNRFKPFIKEGVQTLSDGKGWGMFNEMLERIGYDVEVSQFMQVTEAKLVIDGEER